MDKKKVQIIGFICLIIIFVNTFLYNDIKTDIRSYRYHTWGSSF